MIMGRVYKPDDLVKYAGFVYEMGNDITFVMGVVTSEGCMFMSILCD
jgi:hypothetical protein